MPGTGKQRLGLAQGTARAHGHIGTVGQQQPGEYPTDSPIATHQHPAAVECPLQMILRQPQGALGGEYAVFLRKILIFAVVQRAGIAAAPQKNGFAVQSLQHIILCRHRQQHKVRRLHLLHLPIGALLQVSRRIRHTPIGGKRHGKCIQFHLYTPQRHFVPIPFYSIFYDRKFFQFLRNMYLFFRLLVV